MPLSGQHDDREFTAADYETNPPAGGDHNPIPLAAGRFYTSPPPLGQSVHLLEHGAVIGWTNGLSERDDAGGRGRVQQIARTATTSSRRSRTRTCDVRSRSAPGARCRSARTVDTSADPAVRRAVVRVAEDRRERARLPGRRAGVAELLSQLSAGPGTRAPASRRGRLRAALERVHAPLTGDAGRARGARRSGRRAAASSGRARGCSGRGAWTCARGRRRPPRLPPST